MRDLLLIRHCESSGQAPDAPLTERGQRQADALRDLLGGEPIDAIVSSPYLRARQTAGPCALARGLELRVDARLAERRLSADPLDDWRSWVRRSFDEPDARAPGGESAREVVDRAIAVLRHVATGDARHPVVVSHGNLMALFLHSLDPAFGYAQWESMANPDVFRLRIVDGRFEGFERIDARTAGPPLGSNA